MCLCSFSLISFGQDEPPPEGNGEPPPEEANIELLPQEEPYQEPTPVPEEIPPEYENPPADVTANAPLLDYADKMIVEGKQFMDDGTRVMEEAREKKGQGMQYRIKGGRMINSGRNIISHLRGNWRVTSALKDEAEIMMGKGQVLINEGSFMEEEGKLKEREGQLLIQQGKIMIDDGENIKRKDDREKNRVTVKTGLEDVKLQRAELEYKRADILWAKEQYVWSDDDLKPEE